MGSVYVASGLANYRRVIALQGWLKEAGMTVTYDWATLHMEDLENNRRLDDDALSVLAAEMAAAVVGADCLLLVLPAGRGGHVELGIAWASGLPIVLLNDQGASEVAFHKLCRVEVCRTEARALARVAYHVAVADLEESKQP